TARLVAVAALRTIAIAACAALGTIAKARLAAFGAIGARGALGARLRLAICAGRLVSGIVPLAGRALALGFIFLGSAAILVKMHAARTRGAFLATTTKRAASVLATTRAAATRGFFAAARRRREEIGHFAVEIDIGRFCQL